MTRTPTFRSDGPDPRDGAPICYALHKAYHGGWWDTPERWEVSPMVAETAKTWVRLVGHNHPCRGSLDLIIGRFETRQAAEEARLRAYEVHADVTARQEAVKAEMAEAMKPYRDRLTQLSAEMADRIDEEVKR